MPGGISRALRMIPQMVDIAQDVKKLCPEALFINYSNPMTACCRAVRKQTEVPVVGLCHGVLHTTRYLGEFVGLPPNQIKCIAVGLNHLTFIFDLRYQDQDLWPVINNKLEDKGTNFLHPADYTDSVENFYLYNPFCWSLFETYGAFPAAMDRHVVEFFPERFPGGKYYGRKLGIDIFSFEKIIEVGDKRYEQMRKRAEGKTPLDSDFMQGTRSESEQLVEIIDSLENNRGRIYSANFPNARSVDNLPDYAVLELPVVAAGRGFLPLRIENYPDELAAIVHKHVLTIELAVQAALTGNKRLLIEALLSDGSVKSEKIATKLADDLLKAHREHLPQFFD